MQRLANFDVSDQRLSRWGQLLSQVAFGAICAAAMIGLRTVFDIWAPTSGPFAMIYPTVLLSTLYGHWRAGVTSLLLTFAWAWFFVLPAPASFTFVDPSDPARVLINFLCCAIVIVFAEAFRKAARMTMAEIRRAADRRLMLLAEMEHRTKNNFALVASMLELQKRSLDDETLHGPLDDAVGRVRTFAEAYSTLADEQAESTDIDIKQYLDVLLDRLQAAAVPDHIRLYREIDHLTLSREEAVAIGLYVNEALSNSLKYAFPGDRAGTMGVYFHVRGEDWRLVVEDDGVGPSPATKLAAATGKGLGSKLMGAFAQQAGAEHQAEAMATGFRAEMSRGVADHAWAEVPTIGLRRQL